MCVLNIQKTFIGALLLKIQRLVGSDDDNNVKLLSKY